MNKKPALIAALVGVVLVFVMLLGLIAPKASQVRAKQKETTTAGQTELTLQAQYDQLLSAQADAPADRKRLVKLESQIPPTADLPGLIRILNNTADKSAVDFSALAPGAPTALGDVTVIPIQVTIKGTFFAIDQYLFLLENLQRISKVTNLTVTPIDQTISPPQLLLALTANFYTTDTSAGPGSTPGGAQLSPPAAILPSPVPSPTEG